ncbi:hypothetical protein J2S70_001675 [Trueperella bonasi]|uniref:Secreted protein n=1 Tax=Trueperella bonasi TaxID=312286 RepID=A0ABT9NJT1_9ACTO|nr:hypothetical protein [Trueperella bonasi]MDP9807093.1 hypothetical protein [Trueperella bonasi]
MRELSRWLAVCALFATLIGAGFGLAQTTTDWLAYAQTRVDSRNAAMTSGTWEELAALTVPDSPARRADEELWTWLETEGASVDTIVTQVHSAELIDRHGPVLEVRSVQVGAHVSTSESNNSATPICRRWHMRDGLLLDILPCPVP